MALGLGSTGIIFRREFNAYVRSPMGYIVAAVVLLIDGILFYANALGPNALGPAGSELLSGQVLEGFLYFASGMTAIAAVALSIRLVAEERQTGTLLLLDTSPVRDWEILLGKFLSALAFLSLITVATLYMPLLILVNGKIAIGHIAVGYLGLTLLGGAVLAIGMLATALTRHQLVTLASIIEKEGGPVDEMPVVSAVFHNRLKRGMRLQSDPTVIYGLEDFNGDLTREDLRTPGPYNTYRINGLPPGPIANPGLAAMKAALFPADVGYLYFVSRNDGSHYFSESLREHNSAVRKYQKNRRAGLTEAP